MGGNREPIIEENLDPEAFSQILNYLCNEKCKSNGPDNFIFSQYGQTIEIEDGEQKLIDLFESEDEDGLYFVIDCQEKDAGPGRKKISFGNATNDWLKISLFVPTVDYARERDDNTRTAVGVGATVNPAEVTIGPNFERETKNPGREIIHKDVLKTCDIPAHQFETFDLDHRMAGKKVDIIVENGSGKKLEFSTALDMTYIIFEFKEEIRYDKKAKRMLPLRGKWKTENGFNVDPHKKKVPCEFCPYGL